MFKENKKDHTSFEHTKKAPKKSTVQEMKAKLKNKEAVDTFFVFNPFGTWMGLSVVYLLGWNCRNG